MLNPRNWSQVRALSNGVVPASIAAALCLCAGLWITSYVGSLVEVSDAVRYRTAMEQRVREVEARFEGHVREVMSLGKGLRSYVAMNPDLTESEFEEFSAYLIKGSGDIRAVSLAPNNVIKYVYPSREAVRALGVNLQADPQLWPTVRQAMESQDIFLSDPTDLRIGGIGFLVRVPIYIEKARLKGSARDGDSSGVAYWGMASLVVDQNALFHAAGLNETDAKYSLHLERANYPNPPVPQEGAATDKWAVEEVRVPVKLPTLEPWDIVSYRLKPLAGQSDLGAMLANVFGIVATLLISVLSFFLVHEVFQVRGLALQDTLTGLANRRLLEERISHLSRIAEREGRGYHLFYLDLDGFKPINDTYGHEVGDLVLKEVARRLSAEIRNADTAARMGGDEFVVLTCNRMEDGPRAAFVDRLRNSVRAPIAAGSRMLSVDVSIGVSSYPEDGVSALEILRSADRRMYEKKGARPKSMSKTKADRPASKGATTLLKPPAFGQSGK